VLERAVAFNDVFNFRDLGGYPTSDGRTVAWRRLYRSGELGRMAGEDQDRFTAIGIRTVVDLRRPVEIAKHGRVPVIDGVVYHHLHLLHPHWEPTEILTEADRTAYLLARYGEMSSEGGEAIGAALRLVADAATAPLVFHCAAGKDRTGIVAALVLSLLGVNDQTIAADYAISQNWELVFRARRGEPGHPVTVTPTQVMFDFLDGLRTGHGSIEAYVKSVGVTSNDIDAMRSHLLA
jgi:protein tyrosine/serine phosphatase